MHIILACIVHGLFLWQLTYDNLAIVTILFGFLGFTITPLSSIVFIAASECTYPINEELSVGVLMTCGQIFGIIYLIIWGSLLPTEEEKGYKNQNNFSTYFIAINIFLVFIFYFLYNGEYKKSKAENLHNKSIGKLNDNNTVSDSVYRESAPLLPKES